MVRKNKILLIFVFALIALIAIILPSCQGSLSFRATEVTRIQVKDTTIYLAPENDDARVFQIEPIIFPIEAKNKGVYYKHVDASDRDYVNVSLDGKLFAKQLKIDEYGNNIPIYIKLISADNPQVTLIVKVIIETVAVRKLFFKATNMEIELYGGDIQLSPIFEPAHALKGRNLTYEVGDSDIATVDRNGKLTPKAIGVVDVWAISRPEGSKEMIKAHVMVHVIYAPLNYRMDMRTTEDRLMQIVGSDQKVIFELNRLDEVCDPSPKITWYVSNTPINERGVKDNPILEYTPGSLPIGTYNIVAKLENSSQIQILTSPEINVYYPLTNFNISIWNLTQTFVTGDVLRIGATYAIEAFPPESYKWEITTPSGREVIYMRSTGALSQIADLEYSFKEAGEYTFKAMAIVKGISSGVFSNVINVTVAPASEGTDIFGLSLEGKKVGEEYRPYIFWDPLPYNTSYKVEIKKTVGSEEIYYTYESVNVDHENNFDKNGVYIGPDVATFADDFEYRIKGSRYGWTNWQTYQKGSINQLAYPYFDELAPGINSYISSVEDFGKLLNYLTIFRPIDWRTGEETYTFNLFIPVISENLPDGVYTMGGATGSNSTDPAKVNLYNLLALSMGTYVESTSYSLAWGENIVIGGRNEFSLILNTQNVPTSYDERATFPELNYITHYAEVPRSSAEKLPIDSLANTLNVTTSNQLYWAVTNGYKPIPAEGSRAEKIYKIARKVLYTIIATGMNEEDKVHAIYDWLSANVGYNHALLDSTQSGGVYDSTSDSFFMEGVFRAEFDDDGDILEILPGVAVCDGIAKAFGLLVGMEGIASYKVTGVMRSSSQTGHAWNKVMVSGQWFVVDPTWSNENIEGTWTIWANDEYEMLTHKYLFLTDAEALEKRIAYGVYPETLAEKTYLGYMTSISLEYDAYIESDAELSYYLGTYLPEMLFDQSEVWGEFFLSEEYLTSLYDSAIASGYEASYEYYISSNKYLDHISEIKNNIVGNMVNKSLDVMHSGNYFYVRLYSISP